MRIGISVIAGLSAALASPFAIGQVVDGPKVEWKFGSWGKPRAITAGIELMAKTVAERTGGKFTITIGWGTFGGERELLDILNAGGLQATLMCSSYHPEKTPAYTALDLPFLPLPDFETQWAVHDAFHAHPVIQAELAKWNANIYSANLLPQYEFIGKGKPPKTLADFKGMRVRALGGLGDAMRNIGAVPTTVPPTEVYTALERGTLDAVSFPTTYAHLSYKTHEIGNWYTTNMAPGTVACPTLFNRNAWAQLPPQYQKIIMDMRTQVRDALINAYRQNDEKNVPLFKRRLNFITYTPAELAEFRKAGAQPVWDKWVAEMSARGIPAKELLQLIFDTSAKAQKK
ncbi:MAG: TRAP transporter substrate-binding protein DctP [Burkholderiales bacterium]|nr:TRAP transporter substrate-binding protein DctP [Burkholderiales bacterium]